jgi:fused signal recognition particle receptor
MVVVYVVLAVAVAAAIYFLFLRPSAPKEPELTETKSAPKLGAAKSTTPESPPKATDEAATAAATKAGADKAISVERVSAKSPVVAKATESVQPPSAAAAPVGAAISDASAALRPSGAIAALVPSKAASTAPPSVTHVRNVEGMRKGLQKARGKEGFFGKLLSVFASKKEIDKDIANEIEEVLLASDVGVKATENLLAKVRENLQKGEYASADAVWAALREEALRILNVSGQTSVFALRAKPTVVLMVGVNGAGKTTTIGKLATRMKGDGHQVVLAAADTFRAAAVQQLVVWGNRVGVEVVKGKDGADPGSVIFEAVQRAKQIGADVVLADTAGRLHTKSNLMAELAKVVKTTGKALDGAPHEILLVLDATNGQNALAQATEFQQALPLTGVVLTKLDGTAKGGVVLGICETLKLPVRFVGLGETANDLHDFDPEEFVEALLGREEGQA